ncbi:type IV secretion system protein [Streptomycetaceae bacterium NBC_01309]
MSSSGCDPNPHLGSEPDFEEVLKGHNVIYDAALSFIDDNYSMDRVSDSDDVKIKMMWNGACADPDDIGVVTYTQETSDAYDYYPDFLVPEDPGTLSTLECRIPADQWNDVWYQAKVDGENPYKFVLDPIDWTRHELSSHVENSLHWWLEVDDPFDRDGIFAGPVKGTPDPNFSDTNQIQALLESRTLFIAGVVAVLSLLFVACRMALQRDAQPARDMVRSLVVLVAVTSTGMIFVKILLEASDRFSKYFIVEALSSSVDTTAEDPPEDAAEEACNIIGASIGRIPTEFSDMNFFMFLLCSMFMLIGSVTMFIYMIGRVFVLTLLAGLMPLTAAGTATEFGKSWFDQNIRFILAFILIKPAGTIVFVVAIRLSGGLGDQSAIQQLAAGTFLFMGTVLLPAMVVLMFPFIAPAAGGGKVGKALAVAPVAVGAKAVSTGVSALRR